MEFVNLTCPKCDGSLNVEKGTVFYCQYCGTKLLADPDKMLEMYRAENAIELEKLDKEYETIKKKGKIADVEAKNQLKEYYRFRPPTKKAVIISAIFLVALMIANVIFLGNSRNRAEERLAEIETQFEAIVIEINTHIENGDYDLALVKTDLLQITETLWGSGQVQSRWDLRRENLVATIEALQRRSEDE